MPASSAGPCDRVSRPPTSTRPEKRPPWKCGTRPASARRSVDLPLPDGPEQRDDLAGVELERDVAHGRDAARVGEREAARRALEP